nr:hypothetical protein [Tanacetum cinerariifolium]
MMVQALTDMGDTPVETHQTPIIDQPSTFKKPRRKQRKEAEVSNDESEDEDHIPTPSSDPLPSGEDIFILNKFIVFCTSLQEQRKSRSGGLRRLKKFGLGRRVKPPMKKDSLGAQEDASKQGMMIEEVNQNVEIALDDETQRRTNDDEMFGVDDLAGEEIVMDTTTSEHKEQIIEDVSTVEPVTTAGEVVTTTTVKDSAALTTNVTKDEITMAQALAALKSIKHKVVVQEQKMSTTIPAAATTVTTAVLTPRAKGIVFYEQKQSQIPIVSSSKDKGKAKMIEPEVPIKKKHQMRIDEEWNTGSAEVVCLFGYWCLVRRISRVPNITVTEDEITMAQALAALKSIKHKVVVQEQEMSTTIPAATTTVTIAVLTPRAKGGILMRIDEEYAKKLEAEEQEAARLNRAQQDEEANNSCDNIQAMIDADRLVAERLQAREKEEFSKVQKERLEIRKVNDFIAMDSEAQESSTKRTTKHLESDISKKQKVDKNVEPIVDNFEELKKCMEIVSNDGDESTIYYLLVEKVYPLIRNTLHQLWSDVRLQVDHDVEMAYDLLRFIKKQLMEDYALWEVIINGDSHVLIPPAVGTVVPPKTEAQKLARKNELKAKNYALWEVIVNGDSHVPKPPAVGTVVPPKTEAHKLARKNELKAKSTLLLAIPDEHLLKFYLIKDAKSLWEAYC